MNMKQKQLTMKKEMLPKTKEEKKICRKRNIFHICKKEFSDYNVDDKRCYIV